MCGYEYDYGEYEKDCSRMEKLKEYQEYQDVKADMDYERIKEDEREIYKRIDRYGA